MSTESGPYVLPQLRDALQRVMPGGNEELEGAVITGYVVICEWSAGNGERWLTKTAGDLNDDGPPIWAVKGWLWHALETTQRDADYLPDETEGDEP